MTFNGQRILPAVREMKDFEKVIMSSWTYIVLLDTRIGQLSSIMKFARRNDKKFLLHADLVQGLKTNEYAAEFLCQEIKPDGLISTRSNIVLTAKKKGLIAIQRLFLLDSMALDTSYKTLNKSQPDFIEVLPGGMPHIIPEIKKNTGIPILAGGLIRTSREIDDALAAGAEGVTTSHKKLWMNENA